jgi:lysophospholipase L1-like esterase
VPKDSVCLALAPAVAGLVPGELFSADGFHPSAEGYQAWAERMLPAVAHLLRQGATAGI